MALLLPCRGLGQVSIDDLLVADDVTDAQTNVRVGGVVASNIACGRFNLAWLHHNPMPTIFKSVIATSRQNASHRL